MLVEVVLEGTDVEWEYESAVAIGSHYNIWFQG